MHAVFLGHTTVKLQSEYCSVLIDPFFTGNPMACNTVDDFISLDGILLTHGCKKRLADAVEIAKATECTVVCMSHVYDFLVEQGVAEQQLVVMNWDEEKDFPFGKVRMVPAKSGGDTVHPLCGFVVEMEKHKVWYSGNTVWCDQFTALSDSAIDLAFLPIGGGTTMDIAEAAKTVKAVKPREVCPVHYNTFPGMEADPQKFKAMVGNAAEVVILQSSEKETL